MNTATCTEEGRVIWVGDLDQFMNDEFLYRVLEPKPVNIRFIKRDQGSCYAFLEFENNSQAKLTLNKYNGRQIPTAGRKLFKMNWGVEKQPTAKGKQATVETPFKAQHAERYSHLKHYPEFTVYVKDFEPSVSPDDLLAHFSRYQTLLSATVIYDPDTNESRCHSYVKFGTEDDATSACEKMNKSILKGKHITVHFPPTGHPNSTYHPKNHSSPHSSGKYAQHHHSDSKGKSTSFVGSPPNEWHSRSNYKRSSGFKENPRENNDSNYFMPFLPNSYVGTIPTNIRSTSKSHGFSNAPPMLPFPPMANMPPVFNPAMMPMFPPGMMMNPMMVPPMPSFFPFQMPMPTMAQQTDQAKVQDGTSFTYISPSGNSRCADDNTHVPSSHRPSAHRMEEEVPINKTETECIDEDYLEDTACLKAQNFLNAMREETFGGTWLEETLN